MVNPFDLAGPQFLLFYGVFGALVLAMVRTARRSFESGGADSPLIQDYLEIAYLRGGPSEALKVAAMSLIDRGLIEIVDDGRLQTKDSKSLQLARKRLERMLLEKCRSSEEASAIFADHGMHHAATEECAPPLVRRGLLPDDQAQSRRQTLLAVAAFGLVAVAGTKILVALSRGRSNIGLLIVEAILFVFVVYRFTTALRTAAGDVQLSSLRSLFAGLRERASSLVPRGESQDLALLAAVFGAAAIPSRFGFDRLFPRAKKKGSSSCGSSCGTASSCGSSCGGGGCGGGCGGCGS